MKEIRTTLPSPASDTAGACSILFETGGLTVIHDAAGSMEVFVTFEEDRPLEGKRTVCSKLSRLEAITGDDSILLKKIVQEIQNRPAPFISIVGSPVPFTIGTDLEGIAAEAECQLDTPAFAVTAGGFEAYDKGAGEALKKLIQKVTLPPQCRTGKVVNLLGVSPLDYSAAELDGIASQLLQCGISRVHTLTMTDGLEEIRHAAEADLNIVLCTAGLPAARDLRERFGIPYVIGVPFDAESTQELFSPPDAVPQSSVAENPAHSILILGETVLTRSIAEACARRTGLRTVAGLTGNTDSEIKFDIPYLVLKTEDDIRRELSKNYLAVVGDPLYQLLLPKDSTTHFFARPHRALSSRLYPPVQQSLEQYFSELERMLP